MELTTQQQTEAFLWAFPLGALIALAYIIISVLREASPPSGAQLFVSDFLFMLTVFLVNFLYAVAMTEGRIRFYTIFAELVTYILLYFTLGRVIKSTTSAMLIRLNIFFGIILGRFGEKFTEFGIRYIKSLKLHKKRKKYKN